MDFVAIVDQVIALLRQRGRVAYRTLKVQFHLNDDALKALKDELLYAQQVARDEDERILVWTGDAGTGAAAPSAPVERPGQAPLTYNPPIWPRRSSLLKVPWKASASRSRCCLPTSKAPWNSWPTATPKKPGSSSIPCWSG